MKTAEWSDRHDGAMSDGPASPLIRIAGTAGTSFRYRQGEPDKPGESGGAAVSDWALAEVNLTIRRGEVVMLCGQSGCGKTTMTRLLNGLIPGFFHGDLNGMQTVCGLRGGEAPIEAYTPHVGSVFQNPKTQYFNADTTSELAFPCENMGMEPAAIRSRVDHVARRFGIGPLLGRSVFRLSGGQRQKLAVAAATMLEPRLIVMDEPTGNLDAVAMRDLHDMLAELKARGVTVVIAEHRLAWCADLVDRYILFEHGSITGDYTADEFRAMPAERLESLGLRALDLTPYQRIVRQRIVCPAICGGLSSPAVSEPLISVRGLTVGYGRRRRWFARRNQAGSGANAVRERFARTVADFDLYRGEIVGLMGHNGAGKSTLVRTLCGLQPPLDGQILLHGRLAKPTQLTRAGFLVMQDVNYQLFADSVREEVLLGFDDDSDAASAGKPAASAADDAANDTAVNTTDGEPTRMVSPAERCDAILESLDLLPFADRHPMSLSGGQKQRLAIASALMCGKELIVLDEPTSGLDRRHMMQVGGLLRRLAAEGKAVLVVTHDEELAALWCDRILTLDQPDDRNG